MWGCYCRRRFEGATKDADFVEVKVVWMRRGVTKGGKSIQQVKAHSAAQIRTLASSDQDAAQDFHEGEVNGCIEETGC